ncbi:MAG: nucleotidyltransferase family protein [Elusimicrobia bacterium]|nr:nucleotidyltransferase family protein [Elusimicrobiota bacterium]
MEKIEKLLISPDVSVKNALKKMDEGAEKILFAVDGQRRLLGALTDGDVRRWILKGGSLNAKVEKMFNPSPVCLSKGFLPEQAKRIMVERKITCLPVTDGKNVISDAVLWVDFFKGKPSNFARINAPVVIMAGGLGSRLGAITKILPKPLMPINDKPMIEHIIERFMQCGCKNFYAMLNHKSNLIKAYLKDSGCKANIHFFEEKKPLGTAGGLFMLKGAMREPFFVSNCDILIEADYADVMKFHKSKKNKITIVGSFKHFTIPYGVCSIKKGGELKSVREKPEYDFLVNTGLYVMEPEMLKHIPENKFTHITELIEKALRLKIKIGVYPISEKSWFDTGQWEELKNTIERFGIK